MRARNIKPGFFGNELLAEMPHWVRLLFVGLWCMADRKGRLLNRPKRIKRDLFPDEDLDVCKGLALLVNAGFVQPYAVGGVELLQVVNWEKHQHPHHKEAPSELPPPPPSPPRKAKTNARPMDDSSKSDASVVHLRASPSDTGYRIPDTGYLIPDTTTPALPDWLSAEDWTRWHEFRTKKDRRAWTAEAQRLSVLKLGKLREEGNDVTKVIDQSIECGWAGLFPLKQGGTNGQAKPGVAGRILGRR